MKKKFGAILAAGVMACTMTAGMAFSSGCSMAKIPDFDMPEGGYDGSKVTITFANTTGQNLEKIVADAIAEFNVLYPNITVIVDNTVKSWDTLAKNIGTKLTTGKQPHIAFCYSDHVASYNNYNAVLPLDDFLYDGAFNDMTVAQVKVDEMGEAVIENGETVYEQVSLGLTKEQQDDYVEMFFKEGSVYADGKTYTLPFAKSTEVMYYNKDFLEENHLLEKYNIDNMTWGDMEKLCRDILEIIGDDATRYPLGYDSDANLFITKCQQLNSPYTSAAGSEHFLFDNAKNKEFVAELVKWYKDGLLVTQATNNDEYTSNLFTKEKVILSIGSTGGSSYQDPGSTDGQAKFNVGVARIPQADPSHPKAILQGPSVCIFKKDNPQEVLASWLLVKYLTTNAIFQGRYSQTSGYMPVTKSAYDHPKYQEFLTEGGLTARTAKTCKAMVDDDAFYTSDAFMGSSEARTQIEILMKSAFFGGNLDKIFADAVKECKDYLENNVG